MQMKICCIETEVLLPVTNLLIYCTVASIMRIMLLAHSILFRVASCVLGSFRYLWSMLHDPCCTIVHFEFNVWCAPRFIWQRSHLFKWTTVTVQSQRSIIIKPNLPSATFLGSFLVTSHPVLCLFGCFWSALHSYISRAAPELISSSLLGTHKGSYNSVHTYSNEPQ